MIVSFISAIQSNKMPEHGNSMDALKLMKIVDKIYSYNNKK